MDETKTNLTLTRISLGTKIVALYTFLCGVGALILSAWGFVRVIELGQRFLFRDIAGILVWLIFIFLLIVVPFFFAGGKLWAKN